MSKRDDAPEEPPVAPELATPQTQTPVGVPTAPQPPQPEQLGPTSRLAAVGPVEVIPPVEEAAQPETSTAEEAAQPVDRSEQD